MNGEKTENGKPAPETTIEHADNVQVGDTGADGVGGSKPAETTEDAGGEEKGEE